MALVDLDLSCIAQGNGNSVWMYKSADPMATIIAADYFLDKQGPLQESDIMFIVSNTGTTRLVNLVTVQLANPTTVTVVALDIGT